MTLSDSFDLWLGVQFTGMSTRTRESQQTPPIGFHSPQIICVALVVFNSRAVPPGVPPCPHEMWNQEVAEPPAANKSVPVAGMKVRYSKPWASALPSRPHPPGFPACGESGFICKTGLKAKHKRKKNLSLQKQANKQTVKPTQFSWMKNYCLQKLSQPFG